MARSTRRASKKGSVLSVRSPSAVKSFEKLLKRGPLTLVYINAKWCGACHKFTDEVWSPLSKLKNKSVNMASLDSEMLNKTNLNVTPQYYPTLLLVGKDGKAATFKDENGQDTNAMPRNNTLSDDMKTLSTLVQTAPPLENRVNTPYPRSNSFAKQMNNRNSAPRNINTPENPSLGKSPFEQSSENENPSMFNEQVSRTVKSMPLVPDVGTDLVMSQLKSISASAGLIDKDANDAKKSMTGGKMLKAIRSKTASLKAMLRMRKRTTRRR